MLPTTLTIPPVGAVAATSPVVAIGDGRQAAFQRALQSLVGQSVTGEVLARFNDGSFMVNVAEHGVRMQLPADASVGSRLPLTVLSAEPRASFELRQPSSSVVLVYGEAHASDGTADLYSPASHASAASSTSSASLATRAGASPGAGPGGSPATSPGTSAATSAATSPATSPATTSASSASVAHPAANSATNSALNSAISSALSAGVSSATNATQSPAPNSAPASAAATYTAGPAGSASAQVSGDVPSGALLNSSASAAAQLASGAPTAPALAAASLLAAAGQPAPLRSPLSGRPTSTASATPGVPASDSVDERATGMGASAPASAALAGSAPSRAHSSAASLLGKAPLTPLAELPGLDAGTAQPELSGAARMLGTLLGQPLSASALPLLGKTALFGHAAPDPAQLAQTLQSSIEDSGLFYESHLAAWSRGERSLEQLQREPQMQTAPAATPASGQHDEHSLDRNTAQQINQQLLAQEQGRVQWQGETWPGQPMQWEIQRQSDGDQHDGQSGSEDTPATIWQSSLRLRFPALGHLSATITMVGQQVHLQIRTDADASSTTLREQAPALTQSMAAAGIPLSSLKIDADDAHDG